jgi:uncharacterized protein YjhX (UPF0386 family)
MKLRQEDLEFEASLGYISETLSQKTKKKRKEVQRRRGKAYKVTQSGFGLERARHQARITQRVPG